MHGLWFASLWGCATDTPDPDLAMDDLVDRVAALEAAAGDGSAGTAPTPSTDLDTLRADVSTLQSDITAIQDDLASASATVVDVDARVAAAESDLAALQATADDLQARVTGLEALPTQLADAISRIDALEAASGTPFWQSDGSCNCSASSAAWTDVSGSATYVSTERDGAVLVSVAVEATTTWCNAHDIRVRVASLAGGYEFTSLPFNMTSFAGDGSEVTALTAVADLPGPGDYVVTAQYMGEAAGGTCLIGNYNVVAVQLQPGYP